MQRRPNFRSSEGLAISVLISFIGIFIIGPLSMFVFELARYNLADQQLKNCVDLAALTAACSTTGSDSTSASATQTLAMNQAAYMFSQNTIFSQSLTTTPQYTYGTANPTMSPAANQAQLYFQFLDPITKLPVAYGSDRGKILRVTGAWGFVPSTAKFIGLAQGPYVIVETSDSGLPQLDVVLCLDLSGSMDDFTNISLVKRYSTGIPYSAGLLGSGNGYKLAGGSTYTDASGTSRVTGQGPLYYAVGCSNATGCSINATWPIDYFSSSTISSAAVTMACDFSGHGVHTGTYAPNSLNGDITTYTDLVVNLDGSANMSYGCTVTNSYGSFTFPAYSASDGGKCLGILCEASRGNLESVPLATAAHVPYLAWGITPQKGWWDAYYQSVMSTQTGTPTISSSNPNGVIPLRHPIGDAIVAAQNFFGVMNNDADVHFGLVCFGSNAGTSSSSYMPNAATGTGQPSALTNYSSGNLPSLNYPPEPITCPNPTINLIPTAGPSYSNFSTSTPPPTTSVNGAIYSAPNGTEPYNISTVMAYGGTNIADALDMALSMELGSKTGDPTSTPGSAGTASRKAQALARPGATRAIVLFTDGLPTSGGDSYSNTTRAISDPYAQAEANCAASAGIPIYTIGLCMIPSLQADQTTVLTDTSGSTGLAALSKNNATFTQTTSASQLNNVFQNVARQLVQLVQ